jgi:hypothetical protein
MIIMTLLGYAATAIAGLLVIATLETLSRFIKPHRPGGYLTSRSVIEGLRLNSKRR